MFQDNLLYRFTSGLDSDMVLDVSQNPKQMNSMILYKWNNGANQKFSIRLVEKNKYSFFCSKNGMTVQVSQENKNNNGAPVVCSQPNKRDNQFWQFVPCTDPKFKDKTAFYIRSCSGRALDVCEGKAKNEQLIIQWDYSGQKNQIWVIQPVW